MELLRSLQYTVEKVEHRLPRGWTTVDFMGFADILAIRADLTGVLAVQATTTAHLAEHVKKVIDEPRSAIWLLSRNGIWVVAWGCKDQGDRKRWTPKVVDITTKGPETVILPPT